MNGYQGTAILIVGDTETPVTAELEADRSGPLEEWGGQLRPDDPGEEFGEALEEREGTIRLGDGREGAIVAGRTSANHTLTVRGTGPVPFD